MAAATRQFEESEGKSTRLQRCRRACFKGGGAVDFASAYPPCPVAESLKRNFLAFQAGEFQHDHQVADFLTGGDMAHRQGDACAGLLQI